MKAMGPPNSLNDSYFKFNSISTQLAPQWRIYCHESLKVAKKGTFEGRFWPPPQISKPFHLKEYKIAERYL